MHFNLGGRKDKGGSMERIIVDGHCDTITKLMETGEVLSKNSLHIDLERSRILGRHVQFFAIFFDSRNIQSPMNTFLNILKKLNSEITVNENLIQIALCFDDIISITEAGRTSALISIEGGDVLEGDIGNLQKLYDLGVRSIGLTWNHRNKLGCGSLEDTDTGLTVFGKEVAITMNKLKMIIDVSHLSMNSFWDVMDITKDPIIASHSNAKGVCKHKRNLCDRQITAIKDNGGVIGINFYPEFLNTFGKASIYDIIRHIEYISGLIGTKYIGLGSDFDGIDEVPRGVEDITKIEDILNLLARKNYTQEQIDDIAGRNFLRVINRVIG